MNAPISKLITMPEGKTLEFKRDISSPKNIIKTLVAFANTAGGRLLIGVEDDTREVRGVEEPLDEERRLCDIIADGIVPRLVPSMELISIGDKTLLSVEVYPSGQRPHWVRKEGSDEGVYVRLGSTNRKADRELIAELKRTVTGISFDEQALFDKTVDDLDLDAARACFEGHRKLMERDLESLRLVVGHQGHLVPTVGGILLFGKNREMIFPDAWIQCGRFVGKDKADIFDHIDINEHLPVALERVMEFLKKHAMRGADFSELRRRDVWSIPLTILREALVNAVVHADYSQRGAPIRVAFFDDRIEIENPGILLPGMTVEDMLEGASKIRNHVIARVFRELDLIEQWGSGVRRMFKEAEELGLPSPKIIEVGMRIRFTVYLAESIAVKSDEIKGFDVSKHQVDGLGAKTGTMLELQKHQVAVLKKCKNDCSIVDLMELVDRTDRSKFRKRILSPLLDRAYIEMTIPDKPTSSKQKYRITPKGQAFLTQEKKEDNK